MDNAERSPTFLPVFDSIGSSFRVWKEMDERAEEPVVIYHSHTRDRGPYPSRTDISLASEPGAHYVLVLHPRGGPGRAALVPHRPTARSPREPVEIAD